ncbi:hypothetical protein [Streptomyces sp. NPDC006012]|uniref:hypothetical protein n=1 Tax=Streptomyces sp. NPDC006012 TaxID=3364739 RepID=UPI0036BDB83B
MAVNFSDADARTAPRWSRMFLWPGSIPLVPHAIFMMQCDPSDVGDSNFWVRFIGAASVVPILAQALLIAGLVGLVL